MTEQKSSVYRFSDVEVREGDFQLKRAGEALRVEPKVFRVLVYMLRNPGRLIPKDELLTAGWGDTAVTESSLTRSIALLRQLLDDDTRAPRFIETVSTVGYRFICPVESIADIPSRSGSMSGNGGGGTVTVLSAIAAPIPPVKIKPRWRRLMLITACLSLAALLGLRLWHRHFSTKPSIRSLVVLPLEDLSPGAREEYFADGLTDELITELARIPSLRIVSRTSAMQEKGTHKPLAQIARELNVDAVVEGSVVRSGDRVRITAQLIDARSDRNLWAKSFEGPFGDVLSLQDSVASEIASQTRTALTPAVQSQLATAKHVNPAAHDAYLRGLYFIQRRDGLMAASSFREAIALEPEYAEAQGGLSEALLTQFMAGQARSDVMPAAIESAKRAIELDPYSGEARTALGAIDAVYLWDWDAAEQNLRKGIALSPSNSNAEIWLAIYLLQANRLTEAVEASKRAVELDPLSFWANRNHGAMLYFASRYDESLAALKRAAELAPDRLIYVELWNSAIYELKGRYGDAVEADLKLYSDLTPADISSLRSKFKTGGWKAFQEAEMQIFLPRVATPCVYWGPIAMNYLRLGNFTEAFNWFNREVDEHCLDIVWRARDPRLDPVRSDPRYIVLLRRMNLLIDHRG
jgi:TolB-like protein/DNA-binding winged helix-turn-helix (wHTH) protein